MNSNAIIIYNMFHQWLMFVVKSTIDSQQKILVVRYRILEIHQVSEYIMIETKHIAYL